MIVGIDLGTTNSAIGVMTEDGPRLIPNALGEVLTPSVVGVDSEGKVMVGRSAREFQVVHPDRCASAFKRHMGTDWSVTIDELVLTPEKLSSLVLGSLKADAEEFLGEPVERAVVTVPAYFNDHQRKATIGAAEIAGLKVDRLLNEPTAAAIAYGFHESTEEKSILVYDLGGGTFDVSIVEMFEGVVEVRSSSGDSFLGGEDFTMALVANVLRQKGMTYEHVEFTQPKMVARLTHLCESAKRRLATERRTTIPMPTEKGEIPAGGEEIILTREQLETWTKSILDRTEVPLRRAMIDAGLREANVHEVIMVGGATRMHLVTDQLADRFECEPHCRINPEEVVTMGAAVQAGLIDGMSAVSDLVVTDVAPFTLGVETTKQFGDDFRSGYMLPIIHRNTTIPVSRVKRVSTIEPNQTQVRVRVYQGESRRVSSNVLLGEFTLDGIPKGQSGQQVDIRLTYDLSGVLEVEATVVETNKKITHIITQHARGLSQSDIERIVEQMQAMKPEPREEAKNHALIKRAERVYQQLAIEERQRLDRLIDIFEESIATGKTEEIDEWRDALEAYLDEMDYESNDGEE